jgi:glycosyltransferase involved in cell wall biosynthesis
MIRIIVVPCFNEQYRFKLNYYKQLISIKNTFWIFVNDGSTDNTIKLIKKLASAKNVAYLSHNKNMGKSNSIRLGMEYALNNISNIKWIGFLDADGAFSVNDVRTNLELTINKKMHSYDAIYASRVKLSGRTIVRNYLRHIFSRIIITFFGIIWKNIPYDTQTGFKLYRYNSDLHVLFNEPFITRWFVDIELTLRYIELKQSAIKVWEQPVLSWSDVAGSKVNKTQIFRLIIEIILIYRKIYRLRKFLTFL